MTVPSSPDHLVLLKRTLDLERQARENAERAFFEGDRPGYRWWLAICHTLDRRMADAVSARFCFEGESEADPRPAGNLT